MASFSAPKPGDAHGSIKMMTQKEAERLAKEQNAKVYHYEMPTEQDRMKAIDPPDFPLDRQEQVFKRLYDTVQEIQKRAEVTDREALRKSLARANPDFAAMQKHRKKTFEILTEGNCDADYLAFLMYGVKQMRLVRAGEATWEEADQVMMQLYDYLHQRKNHKNPQTIPVQDPRKVEELRPNHV